MLMFLMKTLAEVSELYNLMKNKTGKKQDRGLSGGAVVKGAVLLCHQSPWVRAQALSQPAASVGRRTIGLASSGLGRDWSVGIFLSHRAPTTPVAGQAQVARCTTHWCGWLPGWMRAVLRSNTAGWVVYRRTHDIQPSSLPSLYGSCSNETR